MEMPLWEGSGSSWPELSLTPGTMSAVWGALQIMHPPSVSAALAHFRL